MLLTDKTELHREKRGTTMKKTIISFLLRMAVVLCVLFAMYSLEAYTIGKINVQMLAMPVCSVLAWAAYKAEENLHRAKKPKSPVTVAVKKHSRIHAA